LTVIIVQPVSRSGDREVPPFVLMGIDVMRTSEDGSGGSDRRQQGPPTVPSRRERRFGVGRGRAGLNACIALFLSNRSGRAGHGGRARTQGEFDDDHIARRQS
jgi:hypothetical protein